MLKYKSRQALAWGASILLPLLLVSAGHPASPEVPDVDQIASTCRKGCVQTYEAAYKKAGAAPSFVEVCVTQCRKGWAIKNEGEIPGYCRDTCDKFLATVPGGKNPQVLKKCLENCQRDGARILKRQGQGSTGPVPPASKQ